ncbi:TPR_REGION domain-containing protein [Physcia stellaris]|nr:TPR_REGION domain-containing protein [Physcia stellaris]
MTYRSLDSTDKEIRLVIIKAGVAPEPIKCYLKHVSLNDSHSYAALSYVWGDLNNRVPVTLDGHAFEVTHNLGVALRYLRDPQCDRVFWIDAICIDQDNIDERSDQVRIMKEIYHFADHVVSWLGESDEHSEAAIVFLAAAHDNKFSREWLYHLWSSEVDFIRNSLAHLVCCLREDSRDYWKRLWITQEIAVAQDGYILVGDTKVTYQTLQKLGKVFSEDMWESEAMKDTFIRLSCTGVDHLWIKWLQQDLQKNETVTQIVQGTPFLTLLADNWWKSASNPRDKVFGLLGLSDMCQSAHPGLKIDYRRSIRDVYIGAATAIIDSTSSLEILRFCILKKEDSTDKSKLPSWVPDWGKDGEQIHSMGMRVKANKAASDRHVAVKFYPDKNAINTVGFRVGKIKCCPIRVPAVARGDNANRYQKEIESVLRVVNRLRTTLRSTFDNISGLDLELLRTVYCGQAQENHLRMFFKFIDAASKNPASLGEFSVERAIFNTAIFQISAHCSDAALFLIETEIKQSLVKYATVPHVGVGVSSIQQGDEICIFLGSRHPMVIRKHEDYHKVVGYSYIDTLANGEAISDLENGVYEISFFTLL